jgi:hypothetical protein
MSNDLTAATGSNGVATTTASNRIADRRRLTKVALTFFSIRQSERDLANELEDIGRNRRPDIIRKTIDEGDAMLAAHRSAIGDLCAALVPVTQKDIAIEIGDLMLAFPGKDDLREFIPLLFDHIMVEHPSRLVLAAACHRLRCTKKFRPTIAEVLEQLAEAVSRFRGIEPFANLIANLDKARTHLAEMEAEHAAELAEPRFVVQQPLRIAGLRYRSRFKFLLIDRHDEQKEIVRRFYDADAVVEFMKTADPATTECSDETKAALVEAERNADNEHACDP